MSEAYPLLQQLRAVLPSARLEPLALPASPGIRLQLLNSDYPQEQLTPQQVQVAMDNPLYWAFCWASGQVLAQYLLSHPELVAGKRVLDFGCGSGVVAIAAAQAGAAQVIACDIDPLALRATALNASLNGVALQLAEDFHDVTQALDLIIVADVLYDRANLGWLDIFVRRANAVLVADSRVKDFCHPHYEQVARYSSCTLPDLDESAEFRDVRLYRGHWSARV
tara:strand:- start:94392 stop:95060 length:669 start_codon:yes stop_codon:yes gene_type:complete